jgi:hypothetical protein
LRKEEQDDQTHIHAANVWIDASIDHIYGTLVTPETTKTLIAMGGMCRRKSFFERY